MINKLIYFLLRLALSYQQAFTVSVAFPTIVESYTIAYQS